MIPYRAVAALSLFGSLSVAQSTIRVPSDAPTIQAGIDLARTGDTVLVAPGTYLEFIEFRGKAITVQGEAGAAATTIDSQSNAPVVGFLAGEDGRSVLRGFTITGGNGGGPGVGVQCQGTARRSGRSIRTARAPTWARRPSRTRWPSCATAAA
jgi:hypothetical protein